MLAWVTLQIRRVLGRFLHRLRSNEYHPLHTSSAPALAAVAMLVDIVPSSMSLGCDVFCGLFCEAWAWLFHRVASFCLRGSSIHTAVLQSLISNFQPERYRFVSGKNYAGVVRNGKPGLSCWCITCLTAASCD